MYFDDFGTRVPLEGVHREACWILSAFVADDKLARQ